MDPDRPLNPGPRQSLRQCRRVVVKLGTAVVLNASGKLNGDLLFSLAHQILGLRKNGLEVLLVSSGAVGLGRKLLRERGDSLPEKQALAAIGQVELMKTWGQIFGLLDVPVAQILLTREDLEARSRYLNARNTVSKLLQFQVLPVFNENDSLATAEIRFGDNDILASLVGALCDSDLVINLTQARGLLRLGGRTEELVPLVHEINDEITGLVQQTTSTGGTGGMASKLEAARVATECGIPMIIARAAEPDVLTRLLAGEELGTLFVHGKNRLRNRKRWLLTGGRPKGRLYLDPGATAAVVHRGSSLLAVGVRRLEGVFGDGELVSLCDENGHELARGLVNYDSRELGLLIGRPSSEFESLLGYRGPEEIVHRDHLLVRKERIHG
jgi:glutamate 5-kinase